MTAESRMPGALLVHIAFHYLPERVSYLESVIRELSTYGFDRTDVVVDTNVPQGCEVCVQFPGNVQCEVHRELPHPFDLTWAHRAHMKASLEDYAYFMYLEDDILVPWRSVTSWVEDTRLLRPMGLIRGFVRVERFRDNEWVSTDFRKPARNPAITTVGGRRFFFPPWPYQGFWLYTREQMCEFSASASWKDGSGPWPGIREQATSGLIFTNCPKGLPSRLVVPLTEALEVPQDVCVHHLPNTYAERFHGRRNKHGTVPVAGMVKIGWLRRRWLRP